MPDVYCELNNGMAELLNLPKYVTYRSANLIAFQGKVRIQIRIQHAAERIWQEDESGVIFVKNRNSDPETTPVDMTEFVWIKLKSVPI